MNCGNCKHWDKSTFDSIGFKCHTEDMSIGICNMAWPGYEVPENKYQMVATAQSEGIYGELITQEGFGCILFQQKTYEE